jgi:hypothetical protein
MIVGPGAITCSLFGLIALEHTGVCIWTMLMGIVITFMEWGGAPCCYKVTKEPARLRKILITVTKLGNYYVRAVFYILTSILMFFHGEPLQVIAGVGVLTLSVAYAVAGYQGGSDYGDESTSDYRDMDSQATGSGLNDGYQERTEI